MKATRINVEKAETRESGMTAAVSALQQKKNIVIPTDTVYGIAADAFSPEAVEGLLGAKGRSRMMPPPVLIFDQLVMQSLAEGVSSDVTALAEKFWPGALTLILYAQPSLQWDLGETQGTVALRVPDDEVTLELLRATGPLAVSSANKTGMVAATTADEAMSQLGERVELILDGGPRPVGRGEQVASESVLPSTIVDCTSDRFVVVREGAISVSELRKVVPSIVTRAELEAEEKKSELTPVEGSALDQESSQAPEPADEPIDTSLPEGPRAQAAEPGSMNEKLLLSNGWMKVDQLRVSTAHAPSAPVRTEIDTPPLAVADAYALVHGGIKDETAQFSQDAENPDQGAPAEDGNSLNLPEGPAAVRAEVSDEKVAPWTKTEES